MKNYIYFIFIFTLCMNACKEQNKKNGQDLILSGKIIIHKFPDVNGSCYLFENNKIKEFSLPNSSDKKYAGLSWLNNSDYLIGIEYARSKTTHSNLVLIDTSGNIIQDIITTQKGHYISAPYMSPNDSLLFFITEVESENKRALDLFIRPITINIINFKTQAIVKQLPDFCSNLNFEVQESPWSPDGNRIVYSIHGNRNISVKGEPVHIKFECNEGVYIYNIKEDTHKKILNKGHCAVWSPQENIIAFIAENNIWLYNLSTNRKTLLYEAVKHEQLKVIHWSPNGKFIFVVCPKYFGNNFNMKHNEKLISVKDKKEVDFEKPNIGLNSFTWK